MSSAYHLTERASDELEEIHLFGMRAFGPQQAERYSLSLERCLQRLAHQPRLGRQSESIHKDLRRHEHGSHVILYREIEGGILVAAIVHARSVRGLIT